MPLGLLVSNALLAVKGGEIQILLVNIGTVSQLSLEVSLLNLTEEQQDEARVSCCFSKREI